MEIKRQKWIIEDERGKCPGQKFKSLLVMQYILKYADDEHPVIFCSMRINPSVSLSVDSSLYTREPSPQSHFINKQAAQLPLRFCAACCYFE